MGCGCNKIRVYSATSPLVVGEPSAEPAINVRATITIMGLRAGSEFWVAGTGVPPMVEANWLQVI